jgi:hypothetical protein
MNPKASPETADINENRQPGADAYKNGQVSGIVNAT